jgi:O-acetyl-ADP-ribose deacetylase (regulator of RNase III)
MLGRDIIRVKGTVIAYSPVHSPFLMSKAFLTTSGRRSEPILRNRFALFGDSNRAIEIWTTPCIVTNFGHRKHPFVHSTCKPEAVVGANKEAKWILVNPCNAGLTGCRNFPYFPRGGPVPQESVSSAVHRDWQPLGYVSQWGGMNVGDGMMYAVSVVDGLVHQMGGWKLQAELEWIRVLRTARHQAACPIGSTVATSAGNDTLAMNYDAIIHTTPPFYKHDANPEVRLSQCYSSILEQAFEKAPKRTALSTFFSTDSSGMATATKVAVPLLGSGARGFPVDVACQIAAQALQQWSALPQKREQSSYVIAFGLLDETAAHILSGAIASPLFDKEITVADGLIP